MAESTSDVDLNIDSRTTRLDHAVVFKPYVPARQQDWVRTVVTVGLMSALGGVIFWACRQSVSSAAQWGQTKEMLQIILLGVTGLLGSVIGFYFGTGAFLNNPKRDS